MKDGLMWCEAMVEDPAGVYEAGSFLGWKRSCARAALSGDIFCWQHAEPPTRSRVVRFDAATHQFPPGRYTGPAGVLERGTSQYPTYYADKLGPRALELGEAAARYA